jgi:transposase
MMGIFAPFYKRIRDMHTIKAIGLDTAKSVFQVHVVDAEGQVVVRRQLRRYVLALFERHQRSTPIFGSTSARQSAAN